ncbi:MAG: type IV secretory system conjugative DNA transfer family protein [Candidatus Galacturonibacter soehngenii]|nr:type IV secretory system conjugative DNA transfer family protein [Candidatus Galacturonibacter soehngenii]
MKKSNLAFYVLFTLFLAVLIPPVFAIYFYLLNNSVEQINISGELILQSYKNYKDQKFMAIIALIILAMNIIFYMFLHTGNQIAEIDTVKIAGKIVLPVPAGNGQFGRSWFMSDEEKKEVFECVSENSVFSKAGMVIGKMGKLICSFVDVGHALIVASTRSGKTRRIILTSLWRNAVAGISGLVTDVKGEIYAYTHKFFELLGFKIIVFDLREPECSMHHNFMNEIVEEVKKGNYSKAQDRTWDLVSVLVGEPVGEPLWHNGEASAIAATILIIAFDAPEECKNLTNVYYFLAYMGETDENDKVPLNEYIAKLSDSHPAKSVYSIAKIAPYRTRGSFYTSALGTLKEFTSWSVAEMTAKSDYHLSELDNQKTMIYLILPDEKDTRYNIASLYIKQVYENLVEQANHKGGELDHTFINYLEELGNIAKLPKLGAMMSAGGGRGILNYMVIQSYQQLEKNYEKDYQNILDNVNLTIYLRSPSPKTHKDISDRCGNYTVQVNSSGSSSKAYSFNGVDNTNNNSSLTGRKLLFPEEVGKIEQPYALLLKEAKDAIVMYTPDLTEYQANKDFGLGTPSHNKKLRLKVNKERERRVIKEPELWGVWNDYISATSQNETIRTYGDKVSFLG